MAFENDWFKFSAPQKPTISGNNTRIVIKRKSDDGGLHTYNYNRSPLSRIQNNEFDVEGPTFAHILTKLNALSGLNINIRDIDSKSQSINLEMFKPTEIELIASPMSPRWVGSTKIIVTLRPFNLDQLIQNQILNGFEIQHLQ